MASLEPTPRAYELLLRNIERNRLADWVLAIQTVASDREGLHELNICSGKEEYSSCGPVVHPAVLALRLRAKWFWGRP